MLLLNIVDGSKSMRLCNATRRIKCNEIGPTPLNWISNHPAPPDGVDG